MGLFMVQIETGQMWKVLALALPLWRRLKVPGAASTRNILLGQLDICANFPILNCYSNQIVKAHSFDFTNIFCTVQNTVEISLKIPPHSYHTQPLPFIQST